MNFPRWICILTFLLGSNAHGDLAFSVTSATQAGTATNEIYFTGSLTNTGSTNLYLNDLRCEVFSSASNVLIGDTNAFFANVPGILLAGEVYTNLVFAVKLGPVAPPGLYDGFATIFGGSNIFAESNLAGASFQVSLPDSIGDGIPDWWRQIYFGGDGSATNSLSCATCDADATGQNNQFKYVVGLNPTDATSTFSLTTSDGIMPELLFGPVGAGRVVIPQFRDDLAASTWQTLSYPTTTQTNNTFFSITDPAPSPGSRFYRVQIRLP